MPRVTEGELQALKAQYLAAYADYERQLAAVSAAESGGARVPGKLLDALHAASRRLKAARRRYQEVLLEIAFDADPATS